MKPMTKLAGFATALVIVFAVTFAVGATTRDESPPPTTHQQAPTTHQNGHADDRPDAEHGGGG